MESCVIYTKSFLEQAPSQFQTSALDIRLSFSVVVRNKIKKQRVKALNKHKAIYKKRDNSVNH